MWSTIFYAFVSRARSTVARLSSSQLNRVIENSVRDAGLFAKTARTGNIDVWAEVVKVAGQSVDRTAAETAQRLRDHASISSAVEAGTPRIRLVDPHSLVFSSYLSVWRAPRIKHDEGQTSLEHTWRGLDIMVEKVIVLTTPTRVGLPRRGNVASQSAT